MPKDELTSRGGNAPVTSPTSEVDSFLAEIKKLASRGSGTRGRLIFALDATASRQPTWDTACKLQAEMFREAAAAGGLDMQLVYYRGLEECRASRWISNGEHLAKTMSQIVCMPGRPRSRRSSSTPRKRPSCSR
jgi:hypothetical protein